MAKSHLTSKGQTTIPKEIRDYLQLSTGDQIEFIITAEGDVIVRPLTTDVLSLDGLLAGKSRKKVTLDDMAKAIKTKGGRLP